MADKHGQSRIREQDERDRVHPGKDNVERERKRADELERTLRSSTRNPTATEKHVGNDTYRD